MKKLALKFLGSFWFWWAFLIFVALYGPDLRSWYQTKAENSRLRAGACARMVELEFLAADKDRSCLDNTSQGMRTQGSITIVSGLQINRITSLSGSSFVNSSTELWTRTMTGNEAGSPMPLA